MAVGEMVESVAPGKVQTSIYLIDSIRNFFRIFKEVYLQTFSARVNSINN